VVEEEESLMNIVAIGGSPRVKGNSSSLLRIAVDSAVRRGASAQTFFPQKMRIAGCLACDGCRKRPDSVCVQKDDMHAVYAAVKACDVLVLASPVYFYGLSSWLKAVVDRCYALITPEFPDLKEAPEPRVTPGKGFYLITTQNDASPFYGYQILSTVVYGLTWIGMERRGHLVATGLDGPDDWQRRPDLISAAERLIEV
jgi:multimeric flavodoxin WrbA